MAKNGTSWKPGVSGNPNGRKPRQVEREYLQVALGAVSLDDWRDIVRQAVETAKAGDEKARAWLTALILGPGGLSLTAKLAELDYAEISTEDRLAELVR